MVNLRNIINLFGYFLISSFVVSVLLALFLIYGNFWTSKEYIYKRPGPEINYNWGRVSALLDWSEHETTLGRILGPPYTLKIWVTPLKKSQRNMPIIIIENVKLRDLDSDKYFLVDGDKEILVTKSHVFIHGLNLEYERYSLSFDLQIESDRNVIKENVELIFEKNYKEYKYNKLYLFLRYG